MSYINKSLPLTFILAIAIQTVGLVWYMSSLDSAVENNAREIARHEIRINENGLKSDTYIFYYTLYFNR